MFIVYVTWRTGTELAGDAGIIQTGGVVEDTEQIPGPLTHHQVTSSAQGGIFREERTADGNVIARKCNCWPQSLVCWVHGLLPYTGWPDSMRTSASAGAMEVKFRLQSDLFQLGGRTMWNSSNMATLFNDSYRIDDVSMKRFWWRDKINSNLSLRNLVFLNYRRFRGSYRAKKKHRREPKTLLEFRKKRQKLISSYFK